MVKFMILAGGFAKFIATYLFDSETGTLTLAKQSPTGENPSWIALHPKNSSVLYAVNEVSPSGKLQSFVVDSSGGLSLVDTVSTGGNGPTFTNSLATGEVTAMNFGSPNCAFVATDPGDPLRFLKPSRVVNFPGNGPSNPHMSLEHEGEVFVPDLGGDKIWRLVRDGAAPGNFRIQGQINVGVGSGPRHIAIHDNILFIVSETVSTLTAMEIPPAPNGTVLPLMTNVSTIPHNSLNAKFAAAEILISTPTPQFPDPLIYVSNRNLGPDFDLRGDTIAIFELKRTINTATDYTSADRKKMLRRPRENLQTPTTSALRLSLVAQVPTGLKQIRSMSLGPVTNGGDEFLIAGGNIDGGVAIFRRVNQGRNLTEIARNEQIASRTSFVFV